MPPREPKARYLTREYVADHDFMTALGPAERECYLLISLYADDAGYLEWDLAEIAANIYRWVSPRAREARIAKIVETLGPTRIEILACRSHALMPRVAKRPRPGGKGRDTQVRDDHNRRHFDPEPESKPTRKSRAKSTSTRLVDDSLPEPRPIPVPRPNPTSAGARATEPRSPRGGDPTPLAELLPGLEGTPFGEALAARKRGAE